MAPGGNFDLSVWSLQLPIGQPGAPLTISPAELQGPDGFTDPAYFWTDDNDGSMTMWGPEAGVTTPNSRYARTELREMNSDGSAADWPQTGTHRLSARLRVVSVTKSVAVGQILLGSGGPSTKPLVELYYAADGTITLGAARSPAGGQKRYEVGEVPLGQSWDYVIAVTGGRVELTINGSTTTYRIPASFDPYRQYFKAGAYNQSRSRSTIKGAKVQFSSLTVTHS